ncbi:MAG TPA: (Fe-S)-binding protein [Acidobacteriota bacterium]|nr:(Fe-S)-binding protein [Acidobacteriota bacterium]
MADSVLASGLSDEKVTAALEKLIKDLDDKIRAFLSSCVRCGLCADVCHVYLADNEVESIPAHKVERLAKLYRRYHTWLGRLFPHLAEAKPLTSETLIALEDAVFGRCSGCGRCALNCSVGLDPSAVIRFARQMLVSAGLVPKGIQGNINAAIEHGNSMSISKKDVVETIEWLEEDLRMTLDDDSASIPIDAPGKRILYALNPREVKFFPLSISAAAMIFHVAGESYTVSSFDFDITNYGYFSGDDKAAGEISGALLKRAEELGVEELVIAECGHGYRSNRWELAEWLGHELPIPVRSLVEVMAEYLRDGRIKLDPSKNTERITLHDPCNLVRHGGVIEEQRYLLKHSVTDFVEMYPNRENNYCCGGGGGLLAASEHSEKRIQSGKMKADQIKATGAKVLATPCHNCIDQILELNKHYKLGIEIKTVGEVVADALILPGNSS